MPVPTFSTIYPSHNLNVLLLLCLQLLCRGIIRRHGYDTSYNCLARRAAKSNNFWNRTIRRGSVARRCLMYGFFQLLFTLAALLFSVPLYTSYKLGAAWQVVKLLLPLYFGACYECEKLPGLYFLQGVHQLGELEAGLPPVALPEPVEEIATTRGAADGNNGMMVRQTRSRKAL